MTDTLQQPQGESISERALCEIHNRLSEIGMLMQVLTLTFCKQDNPDPAFMKNLLDKAAKITLHNMSLPQTSVSVSK